ncbi:hypothetical protein [uncultured Prevotella sp.]|uniref:hypothetical protein n=2 Tax=uncultured Prevotella sp. TaxID=159272 RepID=UPI002583B6D2|nr:hypothetical protein [uncultured Prevotella sp.]
MRKFKITYPDANDLVTILIESVRRSDLVRFLSSKGVFYYNASTEELARKTAFMILDYEDLEQIRKFAYRNSNKNILSGFSLKSDTAFNIADIYSNIRDKGALITDGYELRSISKVSTGDKSNVQYKGSVTYTSKKAGRMEFIRTEERDVSFVMKQNADSNWQVEIDGGKSSDGKTILKMLQRIVKGKDIVIDEIRIDNLSRQNTIEFFDRLTKEGLGSPWQIEDIAHITLKRDEKMDSEEDESNDTGEKEATEEQLSGITQAVLDGKNLRENTFVHHAEESGYIFTAMTYIFANTKAGNKLTFKAEFKGNPKIFEVCLENYQQNDIEKEGYEDALSALDEKENIQYRSIFWNNAKKIYDELRKI